MNSSSCSYCKLQARGKLWSKAGQVQNAGLAHGPFAVSDLDIIPDNKVVCLQRLKQPTNMLAQARYGPTTLCTNAVAHADDNPQSLAVHMLHDVVNTSLC